MTPLAPPWLDLWGEQKIANFNSMKLGVGKDIPHDANLGGITLEEDLE